MTNQEQIITAQTQQAPPLQGFSAQLREAWRLFIGSFRRFVGLNLLSIFVPLTLLAAVALVPFLPFLFPSIWEKFATYFMFLSGIVGLLVGLIAVIFSIIGFIALFVLISDEKEGKIRRSLKMGFRSFFRFLGGGILIGLIISLGSVFLLIPGLILAVILSFWPFFVVKENLRIIAAIKRCFQIIKGHFWIVCLRYLIFFILAALIHLIFALLMFILWPISLGAVMAIFILYLIAMIFFINVLNFIFVYVIYKDVSERKRIDPGAKYKLRVKEKMLFIVLIILFLASFLFSIFEEWQPTVRPQITPEEELIYKLLQEQGAPIELPLENVSPSPEMEKSLREEKPVNIIRDRQRLEDLEKIQSALDTYFRDHGEYPTASGVLGKDFVCLVSYTAIPAYRGLISTTQLAEGPYICVNADKIYLESFQALPSISYSIFEYDSLCSIECLPGEKNNFYAINFELETVSGDLGTVLESDLQNLKPGFNCLTSEGIKTIPTSEGEMGGCVSSETIDVTDEDGLNNFREIYIYKTDRFNPDTDSDGYLDGDEVRDGYNPLGPGRLVR